jgi:hypothetical protein
MNASYLYTKKVDNLLRDRRVDDILLIRPQHAHGIWIILQDTISRHPLQITINMGRYNSDASASRRSAGILSRVIAEARTSLHAQLRGGRDDVQQVRGAGVQDVEAAAEDEFAVGEVGRVRLPLLEGQPV